MEPQGQHCKPQLCLSRNMEREQGHRDGTGNGVSFQRPSTLSSGPPENSQGRGGAINVYFDTSQDFQKSYQNRISVLGMSLPSNYSKSLKTVHNTKQNTQPTSEVELRLTGSFCPRMRPHFEFTWCFFQS